MKLVLFYPLSALIFWFLGIAWAPAQAITISGTVEIGNDESGETTLVARVRVSALDVDDQVIDWDICNGAGEFTLEVPERTDVHILLGGPIGSDEYIDTYSPFFDSGTEDSEGMKGRIVRESELEGILALDDPSVDERKGIVMGVVEAQVYNREGISDLVPVAGAKVRIFDASGYEIDAPIVYVDKNGEWDSSLEATSSEGAYVIYNVNIGRLGEIDAEDVALTASKRLYFFPTWEQVRLYPYTNEGILQQESVTVANFEGWGIEIGGENSNLGCFISTLASESYDRE